ncbi:MAG: type III-A CRISPR-associated protein Cas10/Csm1, partial [Deltaproteobacteria bacterium]|nr:type III-A CRISPR-associated protein Cas10/Csm1 [Deltaproteobacteria bacterium]
VYEHGKQDPIEEEPPTLTPPTARLENNFDNLLRTKKESERKNKTYFQLSHYPNYSENLFFPTSINEGKQDDYKELWNKFIEDLKFLGWTDNDKLNLPYATWLSLLKKYTSRIPSATPTEKQKIFPDISLYQHLRITSAIASCITYSFLSDNQETRMDEKYIDNCLARWKSYNEELGPILDKLRAIEKELKEEKQKGEENSTSVKIQERMQEKKKMERQVKDNIEKDDIELFTFLCGDVSGIQEYIYSIPSKGAAKQLKARSFLLQLLCEFIAIYICEQFNLPPCNIIYSGGGRFFILLPKGVKNEVEKLNLDISKKLLEYMKGELHLLLATTSVKLSHFCVGGFTFVWREVTQEVGKRKKQRYSVFPKEYYDEIFGKMDKKKYPVSKYITGEDQYEDEESKKDDEQLEEFAKLLRNAIWMVRHKVDSVDKNNPLPLQFINELGYDYEILNKIEEKLNLDNVVEIIFLEEFNISATVTKILTNKFDKISLSLRPFANYWPSLKENLDFNKRQKEEDDERFAPLAPAQFEDFALVSEGPEKIAIFRADVDNLGNIFSKGLGYYNTLSRSAMLSSALSDFFEGYVNYLAQVNEFLGSMGIVYSGGDDLFIVGAWNKVIDFAFQLREDFDDYTHSHLTFSGGIVVIDHSIPVRICSKMAEEAEDKAKFYERPSERPPQKPPDKIKDTIVIFDTEIGYEEKKELFEIKKELLKLSEQPEKDVAFKGVLNKLFDVTHVYQKQEGKKKKLKAKGVNGDEIKKQVILDRWKWLLVYGLRKYTAKDSDKQTEADKIVRDIQKKLLEHKDTTYKIEDKLSAILRWVEFLTREKAKQKN